MSRILYLGDGFVHSTSAHRAAALTRLGHEVLLINSRAYIPAHKVVSGLNVRTGFRLFAPWVGVCVRREIGRRMRAARWSSADLVWIDGCAELPVSLYRWLRAQGMKIVNYNIDDPFGGRDRRKWDLYLAAVRHHDLTIVVREENVAEARQWGARDVMRIYRSYDPIAHAPVVISDEDRSRYGSEVVFVGTWMPERGPFMARLLEAGVPLTIWGDWWANAAEWPQLRACWRGPAVYGAEYNKVIQCSKVALGLLSKGNRDLHTTRSAEVPFLRGAVFCGQRTSEHSHLFNEGNEAAFWDHADECAVRCRELLSDAGRCERMVRAAYERILAHRLSNDEVIQDILAHLATGSAATRLVRSGVRQPANT